MFAYITNNMQQEKMNEEKKLSEFKQFQDMFNSLQEGVLVVKDLLTEPLGELSKGNKHQIYFVNDIGNRIL